MARRTPDKDELSRDYSWFDETVDVVSAFEYLYTEQVEMSATVRHFERFPSIAKPSGDGSLTPDFTVLFNDGTGLVGEVKRLPRSDDGVDRICEQLLAYSKLTHLPVADGTLLPVAQVDLMLVVPMKVGTASIRRILEERLLDPSHPYKPSHPPVIVQESRTPDQYVFQLLLHPSNGPFREQGRSPALGEWLAKETFPPQVHRFSQIKARRPFVNDPIDPIYLAVVLWTKVFSVLAHEPGVSVVGPYRPLILTAAEIAEHLREMFDYGKADDVERAMDVLVQARLAETAGSRRWRIAFGERTVRKGDDLAEVLIDYMVKPPKSGGPVASLKAAYKAANRPDPLTDRRSAEPEPGQLFNPDAV